MARNKCNYLLRNSLINKKKYSIETLVVVYNKLNLNNILVLNAKKIEFKLNLLFYNIHMQNNNQKTLA